MSNLPPGVTDDMIPGDRPEDIEFQNWWSSMSRKKIQEYAKEFLKQEHPTHLVSLFLSEDCSSIQESYRLTCRLFSRFHEFMNDKYTEEGGT